MIQRKGGTAPGDSPIGFGSPRLLLAPRREKARGGLRPAAPRLGGQATPQLCARAARSCGSSSRRPRACPFVGAELGRRRREGGVRAALPPPLGASWRPGAPGPALRKRRRRPSGSDRPARAAPALPRPLAAPRPATAGPVTLFRELRPGAAPARPGAGGHRRRGSGNVAPRSPDRAPVKQRPPCRGGRPDARRARGARPRGSRSREPEGMPGANTIPFIQII